MQVLFKHIKKYPKMHITDAVKLLYQQEFGGGHMISDIDACLEYLKKEYLEIPKKDEEIIENIGNGMCRVYLTGAKAKNIDYLKIGEAFILSAKIVQGKTEIFENKLKNMLCECKKGNLPFLYGEVYEYINQYKLQGYPPVSHSQIYKEIYHPAYRVMKNEFAIKLTSEEI